MGETINVKLLGGIVGAILIGWSAAIMLSKPSDTKEAVSAPAPVTQTETPAPAPQAETAIPVTQTATSSAPVAKVTTPAKKPTSAPASQPASLSYQKALELYKDNKRIQLSGDAFCQASPNNVMYKNGTSIMIDNRSPKTRTIKLIGTYSIEGYGFKLVKLSSAVLPATFLMDCNQQQNVAKVLLQK